jgi:hypothetical protein
MGWAIYGSRPSEVQICKIEVITLTTTVAVIVQGVPSKKCRLSDGKDSIISDNKN